jgi:macrolide transport system ATP-binding/permease protein
MRESFVKGLRPLALRLAALLPGKQREREFNRDLEEEIAGHLQMHIDDNLRAGMTPRQARRDALLKLGGVESVKEACRERRTIPFLDHLLRDIRFAIRQLRKNPGFTATAILVLALGMCASVAIFAFVDAALIKPLPYRNPSRIMGVTERAALCPQCPLSYFDYLDWKKLNRVFSSLDVYHHTGFILTTSAGAQPSRGAQVSDGFFRTLGVTPILGRDFYAGEDSPSAPRTVLLSYSSWRERFGGRKDVLGQAVILAGAPYTIIGVLPKEFHFAPAEPAEFWTTERAAGGCEQRRGCHNLRGVARLRDGVSVETASADMALIARQLEKQYPDSNRGQGASVMPLSETIVGNMRPILLMLLGGTGLLLLISTVNVASLLLVRSDGRKRELAVRSALGASRARLVSQFVTEGLVLVVAGSFFGVLAAHWAMQFLVRLIPVDMLAKASYLDGLALNGRVLAFAGVLSLLAAILFAITPAVHFSLSAMRDSLTEGSRGSAGRTWRRVGSKLVVLELATAMVLLVGAGLLGQSFYRLLHVDLAFQPDHLAALVIAIPESTYKTSAQWVEVARRMMGRMASLPGVKSVGLSTQLPVNGNGNTTWIRIVGKPYNGQHNDVNERDVSPDYFHTLRARLLRGRFFTDADDSSKRRVLVINEALARKYFAGEDPVGRKIGDIVLSPESLYEIVGVVDDIREATLDTAITPAVYYPFNQAPDTYFSLVVRTGQSEQSMLPTLAAAIHQIDPGIVTVSATTMNDTIQDSPSAWLHRSTALLAGGFAVLALLLGVVGLYGVVAYSVSQRTREIGVRMALGAQRANVYRLILTEAGWLTGIGIVAGLLCSLATATLMRDLLFGVESWDVPTLAGVAAVLAVASLLASYIPARRAASVNPLEALRAE